MAFLGLILFFTACGGDKTTQQTECITSADCAGELVCIEHQCVEKKKLPEPDVAPDATPDEDNPIIIVPDEDNTPVDDKITDRDGISPDETDVDNDITPNTTTDKDEVVLDEDKVDETPDLDVSEQICGNGIVEGDEQCDDPDGNDGEYGGCNSTCTLASHCGDGTIDAGNETCDDGTDNGSYGKCNIKKYNFY